MSFSTIFSCKRPILQIKYCRAYSGVLAFNFIENDKFISSHGSYMALVISKASAEEFPFIARFLLKHFVEDVPLARIFRLVGEPPTSIPDVAEFILKAEDAQGKLVGVAVNTTTPASLWDKHKSPRHSQVVEFFEFFEAEARLSELSPQPLELWLLGVHPEWRGRGVGRTLVEASVQEAKAAGYRLVSILGISEYTSRLVDRLGWRLHYSLRYTDYPSLSGRDVHLEPNPPHETITYHVKEL